MIKLEINNLPQIKNNTNESLNYHLNEKAMIKMHFYNMKMKTSMIVSLLKDFYELPLWLWVSTLSNSIC